MEALRTLLGCARAPYFCYEASCEQQFFPRTWQALQDNGILIQGVGHKGLGFGYLGTRQANVAMEMLRERTGLTCDIIGGGVHERTASYLSGKQWDIANDDVHSCSEDERCSC